MKKNKKQIKGEYVLEELTNPNHFLFYRVDGKVLGDVGDMPMQMYLAYQKEQPVKIDSSGQEVLFHYHIAEDGKKIYMHPVLEKEVEDPHPSESKAKQFVKSLFPPHHS